MATSHVAPPPPSPQPVPIPATGPRQRANIRPSSVTRIELNADPRTPFDPSSPNANAVEGDPSGQVVTPGHIWSGPMQFFPVGGTPNLKAIITFTCTGFMQKASCSPVMVAGGSGTMVITLDGNVNPPVTPVAVDFVDEP